jgi:hypothetical protein
VLRFFRRRRQDDDGKALLLFLQFNLGQEIKPCTLRHLQIGDKQARKRIINAIRVNAGALEIFNRILPVGNYGKMVHHIDFSESGGERQHVVLVVFCREHYAMCTQARTRARVAPE